MSTAQGRKRTGSYGVFAVRNPIGKTAGVLLSLIALVGCWECGRYTLGPAGWIDKGLYIRTGWYVMVNDTFRGFGGRHEKRYVAIVRRAAGRPVRTTVSARQLHENLSAYVYGGQFWDKLWPIWGLWPILAVACLVSGQIVDVRRLRKARQTGVFLGGNRLVDADEWNSRANEVTSA